jgi:flagellar basal-body rod protein FlgF
MENAIIITLSRQIALQRKMDITANNMANMNTAGFKADGLKFEEYLSRVARERSFEGRDRIVSMVHDPHIVRNLAQGELHQSGRELDIAISGTGWLVAGTPQGERYTRNGQLHLDNSGRLVTNEGHPVLGESGEIVFEPGETNIVIGKDGSISTSAGAKDRLRLVRFDNPQAMKKTGASLYASKESPQPVERPNIIQGAYEGSNVRPMREMTDMIETVRAYGSISHMLEATDESRGKAIAALGRTID